MNYVAGIILTNCAIALCTFFLMLSLCETGYQIAIAHCYESMPPGWMMGWIGLSFISIVAMAVYLLWRSIIKTS